MIELSTVLLVALGALLGALVTHRLQASASTSLGRRPSARRSRSAEFLGPACASVGKRILGHKRISSTERYVNQSVEGIRDDYEAHALLRQIMRVPSPRAEDLPDVELPPEAIATPLYDLGELVTLFLTPDKRNGHLYWCVRARCGAGRGRNWRVANLGVDLPMHAIDAYRLAAEIENGARRRASSGMPAERRRT